MRFLRFSLLGCVLGLVCQADVLYTFTYTAVTGPVQNFSFSFTAPTFVTDGSSPAFTPFSPTDGTNSWTMTKDLVALSDPSGANTCFMFGTPFATFGAPPPFGPCGIGVGGPGVNQGAILLETSGGLPSAPGIYSTVHFSGLLDTPAGFEDINLGPISGSIDNTGTMTLVVTSVPEPSTLSLMAIGLLALGGALAKRPHKTDN